MALQFQAKSIELPTPRLECISTGSFGRERLRETRCLQYFKKCRWSKQSTAKQLLIAFPRPLLTVDFLFLFFQWICNQGSKLSRHARSSGHAGNLLRRSRQSCSIKRWGALTVFQGKMYIKVANKPGFCSILEITVGLYFEKNRRIAGHGVNPHRRPVPRPCVRPTTGDAWLVSTRGRIDHAGAWLRLEEIFSDDTSNLENIFVKLKN